MKVVVTLSEDEVKVACATYINQILRLPCDSTQIKYQRFNYTCPTLELDTDVVQELTSIAAEQATTDRLKDLEAA